MIILACILAIVVTLFLLVILGTAQIITQRDTYLAERDAACDRVDDLEAAIQQYDHALALAVTGCEQNGATAKRLAHALKLAGEGRGEDLHAYLSEHFVVAYETGDAA